MNYVVKKYLNKKIDKTDCYCYNLFSNIDIKKEIFALYVNNKIKMEIAVSNLLFCNQINIFIHSLRISSREVDYLINYIFDYYLKSTKISINIVSTEKYMKRFLERNQFELELSFNDILDSSHSIYVMSRFRNE